MGSYVLGRFDELMCGMDFNQRAMVLLCILPLCGGLGNATKVFIDQP